MRKRPFTPITGVQIPLGTPVQNGAITIQNNWIFVALLFFPFAPSKKKPALAFSRGGLFCALFSAATQRTPGMPLRSHPTQGETPLGVSAAWWP